MRLGGPGAGPQHPEEPEHRVVLGVDHALLERDDRVVGDVDVLGADLGAALGDVAVARCRASSCAPRAAVARVERVHLELGDADEEARAGELGLVLLVVAHHVADVLAQEALDALAELLDAIDVLLLHPVVARPRSGGGVNGGISRAFS